MSDDHLSGIRNVLTLAMILFVSILIIFNIYSGTIATAYDNEYLGLAYNNNITYLSTDNTPISSSDIVLRNSTGGIIPERAISPGWQLIDAQTGTIAVNYTGGM